MATNEIYNFTVNNTGYTMNAKTGYCYRYMETKDENGKTRRQNIRISRKEYNEAYDLFVYRAMESAEESLESEEMAEIVEEMKEEEPKKTPRRRRTQVGGMEFSESGVRVIITKNQIKFIRMLPMSEFWTESVDSTLWIDVLCDELAMEMGPMTIGAMVSTLREKGLLVVSIGSYDNGKKAKYIAFTELGKKVATKILTEEGKSHA